MTTLNFEAYKTAIEDLAEIKSQLVFDNTGQDAAAIVLASMFKHASKELIIYDFGLTGDITNHRTDLIKEMIGFLDKGLVLKVALKGGVKFNAPISKTLMSYVDKGNPNLDIRIANEKFRQNIIDVVGKDVCFGVADKTAFRLETAESTIDNRSAICSFNNQEVSKKLSKSFVKYFYACEEAFVPV